MAEYIDKHATAEHIDMYAKLLTMGDYRSGMMKAKEILINQESVDIAPPIHAHWIDTDNYYRRWKCSGCSGHTKEAHPSFCPFCGAKMDGKE